MSHQSGVMQITGHLVRFGVMTTGLAIAALVLSVISAAFTGYQWRQSGPALLVNVTGPSLRQFAEKWPDEDIDFRAEIVSAGRMPVTVRMIQLEIEWSDGRKTYQPVEWLTGKLPVTLAPTEVLSAGLALPAVPPEPTLVPCCVSVQALRGVRWSRSRVMPLR
jgi:hypothetical protein